MTDLACLNGQFIPRSELAVSVTDPGFTLGVTVAEVLRTFGGLLFRVDEHLQRLEQSLKIVGLEADLEQIRRDAARLTAHNHARLAEGDDLSLTIFVTPGPAGASPSPTIGLHTAPLPFAGWQHKYTAGEVLVVSSVRQVPASCWPPSLKCRSRMHYYLADREARQRNPQARALLLDQEGFVAEASSASLLILRPDEGLVAPPADKVLPSISVGVLQDLAGSLGLPFVHRDIHPDELTDATEVLLSSTSPCLLPVVAIDGAPVGTGHPGPVFQKLLSAWSRHVNLDIPAQATRFAPRSSP